MMTRSKAMLRSGREDEHTREKENVVDGKRSAVDNGSADEDEDSPPIGKGSEMGSDVGRPGREIGSDVRRGREIGSDVGRPGREIGRDVGIGREGRTELTTGWHPSAAIPPEREEQKAGSAYDRV